ncbi:hypothetical protein MNEG_7356 [Monoraphidium neglectum]|uniref:tRNA (Uracil-5-)-methyltransferase n=1 Tax=Monoraphidium neglectum TaxID=145388 RepID=A0A0D2MJ10_9CHLO|nr:hypothetical protein MNEG_7356 [Monoraphidium neglectum]KIZ00607.1 hypothetical protein MNEG_7356 [Monoraphidium neglectum]|eukprot:XP_013899626.1 hypothetical protein MNEG_7356 [Monoraphidium neglectum]
MSPTSLAYAALTQQYIRTVSKLPAWDKSKVSAGSNESRGGFWRLLVVREGRDETFLPLPPASPGDAGAGGGAGDVTMTSQGDDAAGGGRLLRGCEMRALPLERWAVPVVAQGEAAPEVPEAEPAAPSPEHVLLMVQVNPAVTDEATMEAELQALGSFLRERAAAQGLSLTALWVQLHSGVANAAPAGAPTRVVAGFGGPEGSGGVITDSLCQLKFRISPQAFFQVNAGATCLLYHLAGSWAAATPSTLLLDVCCGTGTIGISLAASAKAVVGIDNVESAVEDAKANAALNGVGNASWVCGAAEKVFGRLLRDHAAANDDIAAIVDPPRAGLHKFVLKALLGCPQITRLVYIACNPDSLARDCAILCKPSRREGIGEPLTPFRPVKALAFDLFPHTPHVESVMLLEREL